MNLRSLFEYLFLASVKPPSQICALFAETMINVLFIGHTTNDVELESVVMHEIINFTRFSIFEQLYYFLNFRFRACATNENHVARNLCLKLSRFVSVVLDLQALAKEHSKDMF